MWPRWCTDARLREASDPHPPTAASPIAAPAKNSWTVDRSRDVSLEGRASLAPLATRWIHWREDPRVGGPTNEIAKGRTVLHLGT